MSTSPSDSFESETTPEEYRQRALLFADLGRYDEAAGEIAAGLSAAPADATLLATLLMMGFSTFLIGCFQASFAFLLELIALHAVIDDEGSPSNRASRQHFTRIACRPLRHRHARCGRPHTMW